METREVMQITPEQLEALIDQARRERWTALVLLGPKYQATSSDVVPASAPIHRLTTFTSGLGERVACLTDLTSLDLTSNSIGEAGAREIAERLSGLTSLDLSSNSIGEAGARAIAERLSGLTSLDLSDNSIGETGLHDLLDSLASRPNVRLHHLMLHGTAQTSDLIPKEILEGYDAAATLAAWRRFRDARRDRTLRPLNEVKLLVVGNEAVGKTSLLRYLIHDKPRDPSEARTPGIAQHERIEIGQWTTDACDVRMNVWDFGGQEMLRGTHRFFLTERSLYLLVLEDRRMDDQSVQDWMKTIRNRGAESPVIVVINKSDEGKQDLRLNEPVLRETYPNIVVFLRTSCDPNAWAADSIAALRNQIIAIVAHDPRLKQARDGIPDTWLAVKENLTARAALQSVLTHATFETLCERPGDSLAPIADANERTALLRLLHEIGTVVAYGLARDASAARREISLLDPNWLTFAVYRVLEMAHGIDRAGEFFRDDLSIWLDPARYPPHRHEFILEMMRDPDIGLCFAVPRSDRPGFLVPEALPASRPHLGRRSAAPLRFRFDYGYLPPSLIPRLIVESHRNLQPGAPRWRTGVLLNASNCEVLVIADPDHKRIDLEVDGPIHLRRSALNVILNDLDAVHNLNPEAAPTEKVPLPDQPDVAVEYDYLLQLEREEGPDCAFLPQGGARRRYRVHELLEGVRIDPGRGPTRPDPRRQQEATSDTHAVILIHGIRTRAAWLNTIRHTLEEVGFKVAPTNYGRFDVFRFLLPIPVFRRMAADRIAAQIRDAISETGDRTPSLIAHSFGTYIFTDLLRHHADLEFRRVIFCGGVVQYKFNWKLFDKRFQAPLLNDVGTRDVWPVLAETTTLGYGSTGTYGFNRPLVRDRWHSGLAHSDFLNEKFCRENWVRFLRHGDFSGGAEKPDPSPKWLDILSVLQPRWVIPLVAVLAFGFFYWKAIF